VGYWLNVPYYLLRNKKLYFADKIMLSANQQKYGLKMPISKNLKTIFVHIPKNAGESIERALGMYGGNAGDTMWGTIANRHVLQHLTASEMRKQFFTDTMWDDYFKFAVVRNPWSKAVSEYSWYLRYGPLIPFYEWVDSLENRLHINKAINILEVGHNVEQFKFIYSECDKLLVDKVIRFENLKTEFDALCLELKWNVDLGYSETTASPNKIDFRRYYDKETVLKIAQIYSQDVEIFGYNQEETFKHFKLRDFPVELIDLFDSELYLIANPDVKDAGVDPYKHYIEYGIKEGRRIR
jgi:chondroitin 4-sulfotransferase 11